MNSPGITLQGASATSSTILAAPNASNIAIHGVVNLAANNVGVCDLGINGNIANNTNQAFGGIWGGSGGADGYFVERCYIQNCIGEGIFLYTGTAEWPNSNFRICNNYITNVGASGIIVYMGVTGVISGNIIYSCASHGIRTDCVNGTGGVGYSQNIVISENAIDRSTPPTAIRNGANQDGFMIVIGAADQNISIVNNSCNDNRVAKQDGIGLGQDGIHLNHGIVISGNTVTYAGLFGIDATNECVVENNIIRYANDCGIKLGTDLGGNASNMILANNLIIDCNQDQSPTGYGIWVQNGSLKPGSIFNNVKISGNSVIDNATQGSKTTVYGLVIDFTNVSYANCDITGNNLRTIKTQSIWTIGTMPSSTGWSYSKNQLLNDVLLVTSADPYVFGYENISIIQPSETLVTNFHGGFDGCVLFVQAADSNTTFQFSGNSNMFGNLGNNLSMKANDVVMFWNYGGKWYGMNMSIS